jgi:PAS domain S-box-containing protein
MSSQKPEKNITALLAENEELKTRLTETEETLNAIRNGDVDAIIVSGRTGEKVFSLTSSETPYRKIIEVIDEGAVTISSKGIILYSNQRFADIVSSPLERVTGSDFSDFIAENDRKEFFNLLNKAISKPVRGEIAASSLNRIQLRLSMVPLPDQMEGDICIVVSDITEIYNFQRHLKRMVDERTSELKIANTQLSEDLLNITNAENALKISEERYSLAADAAQLGTWDHVYSDEGVKITWSGLMLKLYGLPPGTEITAGKMLEMVAPDHQACVRENIQQAIDEHLIYDCEYRVIWPDRSVHWLHVTGKPTYDEATGKILRMNGIARDITERRDAEQEIRDSEERFRLLSDTMLQGIIFRNSEGKITSINLAGQRILGVGSKELLGKTNIPIENDFLREDGSPFPVDEHPAARAFMTGKPSSGVIMGVFNRKDHIYRWISVDTVPVFRPGDERPYQVYSMFEDISNQKNAEREMRKSEGFFRSAFEEGAIPMAITSIEGRFLRVNAAFCQLTGFSREELTALSFQDLTSPNDLDASVKGRDELLNGEKNSFRIEKRYIRKDKHPVWVSISTAPVKDENGKIDFFVTHIQDINKRKNAENRLRESKERFKQLANSIPQLAWIARSDGFIFWFNQRWYDYTGRTPEEMTGWGWEQIFDSSAPNVMEHWKNFISEGKPFELVTSLRGNDGVYREFLTRSIPIKDKHGNTEQWFGTHTDISDLRKVEKELKESQEKLNIALENGEIGTWELNIKTRNVSMDERTEKMFRVSPGKFEGTIAAFENLVHEEDLTHLRRALDEALHTGQPFETIYRTRPVNGESNYISSKAVLIRDSDGKPLSLTGVVFDVTAMKKGAEQVLIKLNEELLRSNTDLQQFAYVASHDLQEPLRMVASFTQLLQHRFQDKLGEDGNEYIRYAVEGSKRMYALLNGLLTFSRIQTRGKEFEQVDMNKILDKVKDNLSLVIEETKAEIKVKKLPVIFADESQMIQLTQNLIENSLKFRNVAPKITVSVKTENKEYVFSVNDKGIGIEPQYFDRIFRIFQRLHRPDEYEGTGIGLAICRRIAERHGGRIWVESQFGKETTFYFTIPFDEK